MAFYCLEFLTTVERPENAVMSVLQWAGTVGSNSKLRQLYWASSSSSCRGWRTTNSSSSLMFTVTTVLLLRLLSWPVCERSAHSKKKEGEAQPGQSLIRSFAAEFFLFWVGVVIKLGGPHTRHSSPLQVFQPSSPSSLATTSPNWIIGSVESFMPDSAVPCCLKQTWYYLLLSNKCCQAVMTVVLVKVPSCQLLCLFWWKFRLVSYVAAVCHFCFGDHDCKFSFVPLSLLWWAVWGWHA